MSCLRLSKLVIPNMKKNGWGRIINISSVSVKTPVNGLFLSNSLRMGVLGWAKALSDELAPHGITVNTVCDLVILELKEWKLFLKRNQILLV